MEVSSGFDARGPRCSVGLALACRWVLVAGVLVPGLAPELDLRLGWLIKMGRAWFGVPDSAVGRGVQDGGPSFPRVTAVAMASGERIDG